MKRDEAREGGYVGWVQGMSVVGPAAGSCLNKWFLL